MSQLPCHLIIVALFGVLFTIPSVNVRKRKWHLKCGCTSAGYSSKLCSVPFLECPGFGWCRRAEKGPARRDDPQWLKGYSITQHMLNIKPGQMAAKIALSQHLSDQRLSGGEQLCA